MARVRYWIGFAAVLSMAALFMTPTVQAQSVAESKASVDAMPDDPPRHYNLGRAFFKAGQFKESIASFKKAIELKEDYKEAYSSLGSALFKARQFKESIASFEKAIELKEDKRDYYNMGLAQQKLSSNSAAIKSFKKNSAGAIRAYKAAIKANPRKSGWHLNLGILYQSKGDYKNAIPPYETYLKLNPRARNAKSIREIVVQLKDAIK